MAELTPAERICVAVLDRQQLAPRDIARLVGCHVNQVKAIVDGGYRERCRAGQRRMLAVVAGRTAAALAAAMPAPAAAALSGPAADPDRRFGRHGDIETLSVRKTEPFGGRKVWVSLPRIRALEGEALEGNEP